MSITFSSCFYIIKSKFNPDIYVSWMNNFISIVNNFNLVIYTDTNSLKYIDTKNNNKIKIIIKPLEAFYNYKYKEFWEKNHEKNVLLNSVSCWELNMLWAEKIYFVKETIDNRYFDSEFYGWCDIGYFRNRKSIDTNTCELMNWPDPEKIIKLDKNKIVYACVNNNESYINNLFKVVNNKNEHGLPAKPIDSHQTSIAGGFFILHKKLIHNWFKTFDNKLINYISHNYLVKDDQIILADCIFSDIDSFLLFREDNCPYDNWFMFQRILNLSTIKKSSTILCDKKISILMPIYNGIEFIDESVTSILSQSYENWELIIGINGHPEQSQTFCKAKQYENIDKRIKVYELYPIKGKSNALNKMLEYCSYDYIALLDVDDIWYPNKLTTQTKFIQQYDYDVVGTKCVYFGDMNNVIPNIPEGDISQFNFSIVNPIINSSAIIKKDLCYWNSNMDGVEDYDLWIKLRKSNKKFYNCPEVLVKHRIHNQSAFNSKGNNNKVDELLKSHGY
jgi:teichuronic acid biosynthesis glycosyltransferase TuaG